MVHVGSESRAVSLRAPATALRWRRIEQTIAAMRGTVGPLLHSSTYPRRAAGLDARRSLLGTRSCLSAFSEPSLSLLATFLQVASGKLARLESRDGRQQYGKADYFAETAAYHDVVQEWAWLGRLHASGALTWRGQPAVAPDADSYGRWHQMEPTRRR